MEKKRRVGWGYYCPRGAGGAEVGSEGTLGDCGEHLDCSGVIPGGLEVQDPGKGSSSMLTGGAAALHAQWPRPPRTVDSAPVPDDANSNGPGGRRQLTPPERDMWLRGEGQRALWWGE